MYLAFGIIFLVMTIAVIAAISFTLSRSIKDGNELISKNNLFYLAPAFLITYFLYLIAAAFNGETLDFFYCFTLIDTALDVFAFNAKTDLIYPICQSYPIYYADFILASLVSVATVIIGVSSFFSQRIRNRFVVKKALKNNCDIVIGNSADAQNYLKNSGNCIILDNLSRRDYADLLKDGIPVLRVNFGSPAFNKKIKKSEHALIVFRDGNKSYTHIIDAFAAVRKSGCNARLYLEANQGEMKVLKEKFISQANSVSGAHIFGFSKYELLARRFAVDYPISKYVPRDFLNANCTLKDKRDIHVVFVGFGKVNYQLFRMCAMQFQFAGEKDGKLFAVPVHYHVYDSEKNALHNEFFSRINYEFDRAFSDCDFPKPEIICTLETKRLNVNSIDAKKEFISYVGKNSFAYFIVSLDDDLADASYAMTLDRLFKGEENYKIFVRAKNNRGEKLNDGDDKVIYFGEEKTLCSHANIVNDDLTELAQRINLLYSEIKNPPVWLSSIMSMSAEKQSEQLDISLENSRNRKYMLSLWEELPYMEQASNIYHALNLPFKLNLLGFDMVKEKDCALYRVSPEEFNAKYVNSGKKDHYSDYSFYFGTESSNVLAYIEHLRWNAMYILYDFTQMKKSEIRLVDKEQDGKIVTVPRHKDLTKKLHACLTTYYGLHELLQVDYELLYGRTFTEADYKTDERLRKLAEIYSYDYMDLDKIYSQLTKTGHAIVDRRKPLKSDEEKI